MVIKIQLMKLKKKSYFDNLFNAVGIHQEPVQNN